MSAQKPIRRFRLLKGKHVDQDPQDPKGSRIYNAGDIIETTGDLMTLNAPGMSPKFEALDVQDPAMRFAAVRPPQFTPTEEDEPEYDEDTGAPVHPPTQPQSTQSPGARAGVENDVAGVNSPAPTPTPPPPPSVVGSPAPTAQTQPSPVTGGTGATGWASPPPPSEGTAPVHVPPGAKPAPAVGGSATTAPPSGASQGRAGQEASGGDSPPTPQQPSPKDLDEEYGRLETLSISELREVAKDEEVDLKGSTKKDDIIRALRSSTKPRDK